MTLRLRPAAISFAFGTVSFFLADDSKTIRVDVDRDVLSTLGPPPQTKRGYLERLTCYRRQLTQIAAAKYEQGEYEPEVRVLVVHIGKSDFA